MSTTIKTAPRDVADAVRKAAADLGADVHANGRTLTVVVYFEPGDIAAYCRAEDVCTTILNMVRQTRSGSTWGTDSGSVGGLAGLDGGYCRMKRSGLDMRVLRYL